MASVDDLVAAVTSSLGIYGVAPTSHLSALARVTGYRRRLLDQAIEVDRSLIRHRTMRYSVYTLPPDLMETAIAATRQQAFGSNAYRKALASRYENLAARVEAALSLGPLSGAEIRKRVDPGKELGSHFQVLLGMMGADCRIVRAANTGGWRSNRLTYALWSEWLPSLEPLALDGPQARHDLANLYVEAYGPVDVEDLRWWAGWKKSEALAAAADVDLSRQGSAVAMLDGLRLLPVWDVLMVAYRNRDRLFAPERARYFYDGMGNATSVVYDRGSIVGVWDLGKSDDPLEVRVAAAGSWTRKRWAEVEEQAARIAAMIGSSAFTVERVAALVDLAAAPRNRFAAPLSG